MNELCECAGCVYVGACVCTVCVDCVDQKCVLVWVVVVRVCTCVYERACVCVRAYMFQDVAE